MRRPTRAPPRDRLPGPLPERLRRRRQRRRRLSGATPGPIAVVAVGGNALVRRGEPLDAVTQRKNVAVAAEPLAEAIGDRAVILTHGNGPQVGLLALQDEAHHDVAPYPLDVLGAETVGMIGHLLLEGLSAMLPERRTAVVLTRVMVDPDDPACFEPTKPIGPQYHEATARRLAEEREWTVAPDGEFFRRVVPSPEPGAILELDVIRDLVADGVVVVACGGGGVPVVRTPGGGYQGFEGVIDKDLTSSRLAVSIGAERLVILTDVEAVYDGFGTDDARAIDRISAPELRATFSGAAGSMGPKVDAVCRFVEATGHPAAIGSLLQAPEVLAGSAGTQVLPQ